MNRMFDFQCEEGHIFELFTNSDSRTTVCKECGKPANRMLSSPRFKLEGASGDFPGAYYKWETDRAKKIEQERKQIS